MIYIFVCSFIGACFVDINSAVSQIRLGKVPIRFHHGTSNNIILLVYYTIVAFAVVLLSQIDAVVLMSLFELPGIASLIKSLYLGFAVSTNFALLSKLAAPNLPKIDDVSADEIQSQGRIGKVSWLLSYLSTRF